MQNDDEKSFSVIGILIVAIIVMGLILLMYYSHDAGLSNFYRGDHR